MNQNLVQVLSNQKKAWTQAHKTVPFISSYDKIPLPTAFNKFNYMVGRPIHPDTGKPTDIFDYQNDYFDAWITYHKLMLNKSRKIGATETALRIIAYLALHGVYANHRVMIVAGNKQLVANRFVDRFKAIFPLKGFTDLDGNLWKYNDVIIEESSSHLRLFNDTYIQAYPANESVRGEENVKCVFLSECAFINRLDDSRVYNALHPNVANIHDADFIMESTPNGRRGFFWTNWDSGSEYHKLEQPYTVSLGKLLTKEFIEKERKNPRINFEQEYCCKFTTSASAVFKPEDIKWGKGNITDWSDILGN